MKIETKLDIGDKIYFVFGNPKKGIVVFSGVINKISIFKENKIMYNFHNVKLEVDKEDVLKYKHYVDFGFFYEKDLDCENDLKFATGLSCWPTFSSKQKCKEYLRRVIKKWQGRG